MANNTKLCEESYVNGDYPVDIQSDVPPELRSSDPNTAMPPPPINGGLFSGPQNNAPYMPQSVPYTTTYFTQHLLKSANPPEGATEQYVGDNRLGNNYVAMPGVNWYNSAYERNKGPFTIKVIGRPNPSN